MNRLDELIQKLCPDGVEYKELKEVCKFQNGFSFKSNFFKSEGLPILRITNIAHGKISNSNYVFFDKADYKENLTQYEVKEGDVVVAMSGATTGKIGYNYSKNVYYLNQRVGLFVPDLLKLSKRYLYHWLTTQSKNIYDISCGSGAQPNLSSVKMMKFRIPIPPIEIQNEIVRMLDNFTESTLELTAKLTAELTATRRQYEYYSSELFNGEYEMVKLEEICNICAGGTPSKSKSEYWDNGKIKWLGSSVCKNQKFVDEVTGYITELGLEKSSAKLMKTNTTIIAMVGATIGKVAFLNFEACTNQNVACLYPKDEQILDFNYLYYACKNLYPKFLEFSNGKFAIASLSFIKNLEIPVPNIEKQKRIVDILERFDKICNDIVQGLQLEIEARQKQYEYYRDKLLTFKELKTDESIYCSNGNE